jgi:AcrR family transcriptional regulator
MASSEKRGPYIKGQLKRQEILKIATRIFSEQGFNQPSMVEIAQECSISRAGLLHYFPSKKALLMAVLEQRDIEDSRRFSSEKHSAQDDLSDLRGIVELAEHNASVPWLIRLYTTLSSEATNPQHPAHDYFVKRYETLTRTTRLSLEKAQKHGHLRDDIDITSAAININALMDGLQLQWLLNPETVDMPGRMLQGIQLYLTVPLFDA